MTKPAIAAHLHPQHATYEQVRDAVVRAEQAGVDRVYNWDHFYPLYGDPDGSHFEAWTMLASWAEVTTTVEIGCLVSCNSYRNPNLLADMARTVDNISDGRLILGIGSGWFERDYTEYGYEFGSAGWRLDNLSEALPVIQERLTKLNPAPRRSIPLLIGGGGVKKTLQYTAKYADMWHYWWNPQDSSDWEFKNTVLREWCEKVNRDESEISRSVGIDYAEIDDFGPVFEKLQQSAESGNPIHEITLGTSGPEYPLDAIETFVTWRNSL